MSDRYTGARSILKARNRPAGRRLRRSTHRGLGLTRESEGECGRGGKIRDEDIALVRERTSIVDVISEHVTLKSAGGGNVKGLCPFHDEKTPSFTVSSARNVYFCHGCGAGGDAIRFVMELRPSDLRRGGRAAGRQGRRRSCATTRPVRLPNRQHQGQKQRLVAANLAAGRVLCRAADGAGGPGGAGVSRRSADSTATTRADLRLRIRAGGLGHRWSSTCARPASPVPEMDAAPVWPRRRRSGT